MTEHLLILVPEAKRVDANFMFKAIGFDETDANGQTFSLTLGGLSASGSAPYTHYVTSIQTRTTQEGGGLLDLLTYMRGGNLPPDIVWADYFLTTAEVFAVLNDMQMSSRGDMDSIQHYVEFLAAYGLSDAQTYFQLSDPVPVPDILAQPPALPCYFDLADSLALDIRVGDAIATPPTSDAVMTSALYGASPLTDGFSFVASRLQAASTWFGSKWSMQWGFDTGRNNPLNPPLNIIPAAVGVQKIDGRVGYTSYELAMAATKCCGLYKIGASEADYLQPIIDAGFDPDDVVMTYAYALANKGTVFTVESDSGPYLLAMDKIILPDSSWSGVTGSAIDAEVNNGTLLQRRLHYVDYANLIKAQGKQAFFYTNPVTGPRLNYFIDDPDFAAEMMAAYDYIMLFVIRGLGGWTGTMLDQYLASKAAFGAAWNPAKICLAVNFGTNEYRSTVADCVALRTQALETDGIGFALRWPAGATLGGDLTNNESVQKMLALMGEPYE